MKKIIAAILAVCMLLLSITACGTETADENDGKISVVTTIFPEYDWVREVIGDQINDFDVSMLLDSGVDLHSFQPTAGDILSISTCDLFVYVGGESDEWVEDALKEAVNKDMKVINLLDVLGSNVKEEEVIEGMEAEEEEDEAEEKTEYDEHVWLSLKNAQLFVNAISDALCEIDAGNADLYRSNADAYIEKLSGLDAGYREAVDSASVDTLLFGDRFPFRYLTEDYGLNYYAAFVGCSAETEASFETITFLSGKVDELKLNSVLTIEGSDKKIAETVIENTSEKDAKILTLDSIQSVTSDDVRNGASYLSIMEDNLEVLKEALK